MTQVVVLETEGYSSYNDVYRNVFDFTLFSRIQDRSST